MGLRHKEERIRKERHSKTRTCSMHTLRQGDTCTTKTKKDHMYIVHVHKMRVREGGGGWGQERV